MHPGTASPNRRSSMNCSHFPLTNVQTVASFRAVATAVDRNRRPKPKDGFIKKSCKNTQKKKSLTFRSILTNALTLFASSCLAKVYPAIRKKEGAAYCRFTLRRNIVRRCARERRDGATRVRDRVSAGNETVCKSPAARVAGSAHASVIIVLKLPIF
ncbi:hypothetical protein EVAR_9904_1 [Eumeta japonica]|uniref:Uncharacterized protein n=1 Tax=Eumeta variegata TaxID=151549 RepID=A0A4C1TQD4_EUMVA|nr:hypothetical protein EVAR_9904_1 [Eumeta japonica]